MCVCMKKVKPRQQKNIKYLYDTGIEPVTFGTVVKSATSRAPRQLKESIVVKLFKRSCVINQLLQRSRRVYSILTCTDTYFWQIVILPEVYSLLNCWLK